jgi:hypothetical protein
MPYEVSVYVVRTVDGQEVFYKDHFVTDVESPFYVVNKVLNDLNVKCCVDVEASNLPHEHYYVHITGENITGQIFIDPVEEEL